MTTRYTVILVPEPDGSAYTVIVPLLPGVVTFGSTVDEALAKAREAITCHIEGLADDGEQLPVESEELIVTGVEIVLPITASAAA
jgi:predicted RNase H-like HicB family nuclease